MTVADAPVSQAAAVRWAVLVRQSWRVGALVLVGVLLGLTYGFGFLRQLSYARFPEIIGDERPLATALGTHAADSLRFIVPTVLAFVLYGAAVLLARGKTGRWLAAVCLATGVGYAVLFVPMNPVGAQDIYHNVFDARILWLYGDNPNSVPPVAYPADPLFPSVVAWSEFASVYGPVWYVVSGAALAYGGDDLRANITGHKVLTVAFLVAAAALAYLIAERLRAGTGIAALIAVAWNPLLLFETAGNAHNDIVMVFFAMASLWALVTRRWLLVFPLLALSVATKYGLVLLGPLMLVWMLRQPDVPKRQILLSLLLGALVGAAVYAPFFQGAATLDAVRRQSGYNTSSPSALLDASLIRWAGTSPEDSSALVKLIVSPIFMLLYGWQVWRVRGNVETVIVRSVTVLFLLMLVATWWFWPWYVMWLVPLAAVLPYRRAALLGLTFSASAMLMYAAYFWMLYGDGFALQVTTAAVAFLPPCLVIVGALGAARVRSWQQARSIRRDIALQFGD